MKNVINMVISRPGSKIKRPARWMVVDDDPAVLKLLRLMLGALNHAEIHCFQSSREALNAFAAAPGDYELLVTDLDMPGMNGVQLSRLTRALAPDLKTILVTGNGSYSAAQARADGFISMIAKPFSMEALNRAVDATGLLRNDTSRQMDNNWNTFSKLTPNPAVA